MRAEAPSTQDDGRGVPRRAHMGAAENIRRAPQGPENVGKYNEEDSAHLPIIPAIQKRALSSFGRMPAFRGKVARARVRQQEKGRPSMRLPGASQKGILRIS